MFYKKVCLIGFDEVIEEEQVVKDGKQKA